MKRLFWCALVCGFSALTLHAAHPLAGKWLGGIDTDRGQMQIGLELKEENGKLVGTLKTAHGDWPVKSVIDDKGTFTVTFTSGDHDGKMVGTIKDGHFAGKWDNSPMAAGTFDLAGAAAKTP
jgi:hypothetical protein